MNIKRNLALIIACLLLFITARVDGQVNNRDLIIGKWSFVRFDWPESVPSGAKIIAESTKNFTGVVYVFTKDNKFIMTKKGDSKNWNKTTTYSFSKDNNSVNLAAGQTMEIRFLSEDTMTIYVKGFDPMGIFRKIP